MKCLPILSLLLVLLSVSVNKVGAQPSSYSDSIAASNTRTLFQQRMGQMTRLYSGVENFAYPASIQGNPYFINEKLVQGTVVYEGRKYENIPMLYDVVKDLLIVSYFGSPFNVSLVNDKLNSFNLSGHQFIHIAAKDSIEGLREHNYEELYKGSWSVLALHLGLAKDVIKDSKIVLNVEKRDLYYFVKARQAYPVNNQRAALKLLKDQGEIRAFLRKNKLKFRKNKEAVLVNIASYWDRNTR